jgi:hypothetical protein
MGERLPPTPTVMAVTAVAAVAQLPLPVADSWGPQAMFTDRGPWHGSTRGGGSRPSFQNDPRCHGRWQRSGARLIRDWLLAAS